MKFGESQPEFRDNFFMTKFSITQLSTVSPTQRYNGPLSRYTWTNKIKRRKLNQKKCVNFQKQFINPLFIHPQASKEAYPYCQSDIYLQQQTSYIKQKKCQLTTPQFETNRNVSISASHFAVSRNVYCRGLHENLSKSGILMEKVECECGKESTQRTGDPRYFLKNLRIKSNINLYKGNFSKFLKKDLTKRDRVRNLHNTNVSQLSPWQIVDKNQQCY